MQKSLIFMLDVSSDMNDSLSFILEELENKCKSGLQSLEYLDVYEFSLRIITFGRQVSWVYGNENDGIPFKDINWDYIKRNISLSPGGSHLGEAISRVCDTFYYGNQLVDPDQLCPVIVLISRGSPTDDYENLLNRAIEKKIGEEKQGIFALSLRLAIGLDCRQENEINNMKQFGRLSKSYLDQGCKSYHEVNTFDSNALSEILDEVIQIFTSISYTGLRPFTISEKI